MKKMDFHKIFVTSAGKQTFVADVREVPDMCNIR